VHVNDAEALLEAVIAGLGRSLLPCVIADGDPRLRRIGVKRRAALSRELWLLSAFGTQDTRPDRSRREVDRADSPALGSQ